MKCENENLKAHITDVLVGEAEATVKNEVLAHFETCAACREERDRMAGVLGLLKEAPPWAADGAFGPASADADRLSRVQRQKVESLVERREPTPRVRKPAGLPMPWLALAASISTVGIALVLARRGSETPVSAPASVVSSIQQLPQAPEGPTRSDSPVTPESQPVTPPAAARARAPVDVPMATEPMREFGRQIEGEQGKALGQAAESTESSSLKNDKEAGLRDQGGIAGGVAGGIVGGLPAEPAPAASSSDSSASTAERRKEMAALRKSLEEQPRANAMASADELKLEFKEYDTRQAKAQRLRELTVPTSAPRDMFFEAKGTNPFIVTEEDPQATFGLDVDTASYTLARNYLNREILPPPAAVRVEEFINSFPNNVAADRGAGNASVFAVRVDGSPNPLHPGYHIIRVAMKAKDVDPRERKAAHLTFVIDVSGSMAAENRLGLVKRSLALLVDKLDERDTIGVVVYGTSGRRVLAPTPARNRELIMAAIDRLRPEGSTNLQDGLDLGYEMALESFVRGASNRVVLCTDGVANTGETEADALISRIRSEAKRGIDMMALGFGMGNYNDALLQRLADEGNGQYAYIDDLGEARAFFLRKLTSVLEVVARDAKAQVEFNPARVERYRLLGYEKRDIADRDFRNDAVDAGEINSGHSVTALFEVRLKGGPGSGKIGVARIRYKTGPRSEGVEFSREIVDAAVARSFDQASPAFRTAFVAARFAEHLRKSSWVNGESLASLQPLADELPEAPQTNELADLIRKAARLRRDR